MCGIAGFYGPEDKKLIREMTALLEHRGPDQCGYYTDSQVSLGHRRLSIIDLSEDGKQPMSNEDGSVWVVFNGEIYNYKELRALLVQKGHRFRSRTDTEVIVHAYEEYGEKCVELLNGCFAFVIYEQKSGRERSGKERTLLLARDRLGIKPLYYTFAGERFLFASEIKSLLAAPEVPREVNREALEQYLTFYSNPLEETMFKGIYKLLPGHVLRFRDGRLYRKQYWELRMSPERIPQQRARTELYSLLSHSVQKRLMADVPLGVYLSGGVDSGSVVALMSKLSGGAGDAGSSGSGRIKTFSVGFREDPANNELARARQSAEFFGTDHREIIIGADSIKALPAVVWHQDEPMGDPTSIPTYFLSKEAKKSVTVVLTGEGADEQFAGYEQEKFMLLRRKYLESLPFGRALSSYISRSVIKIPAKLLNPLFKYMGSLGEEGKKRAADFISADKNSAAFLSMISIFNDKEKLELLGRKIPDAAGTSKKLKDYLDSLNNSTNLLNNLLWFENKALLAENLLMKVDKNTMAHGIEARVPFLDHKVVEFAGRLPERFKLRGRRDKHILRETMKPYLPPGKHRQAKERFFVPVDLWLREELAPLSEQLLSPREIRRQGYFNQDYILKVQRNYANSPLYYGRQLWTLLNFQLWHKTFIEKEKIKI